MWIWEGELLRIGFRRRSRRYWQCDTRFELPDDAYISIFVTGKDNSPGRRTRAVHRHVEVSAFHVTFLLDVDNVHFYYHEHSEQVWEPGGHTTSAEIARHNVEPELLRALADAVAERVVAALHGELLPRVFS